MMDNLSKFLRLTWSERWLFLQALLLLPLTALLLRLFGLRSCQRLLAALAPPTSSVTEPQHATLNQARLTARMVRAAAQHDLFRARCLPQALALWWLLRRQRIAGTLRIGTRLIFGQLQAHAWLEYQGVPLNEDERVYQSYAVFAEAINSEPARCSR
jgi:hypothetical protein